MSRILKVKFNFAYLVRDIDCSRENNPLESRRLCDKIRQICVSETRNGGSIMAILLLPADVALEENFLREYACVNSLFYKDCYHLRFDVELKDDFFVIMKERILYVEFKSVSLLGEVKGVFGIRNLNKERINKQKNYSLETLSYWIPEYAKKLKLNSSTTPKYRAIKTSFSSSNSTPRKCGTIKASSSLSTNSFPRKRSAIWSSSFSSTDSFTPPDQIPLNEEVEGEDSADEVTAEDEEETSNEKV